MTGVPPEALDAAIEALKTRSAAAAGSTNQAAARWHAVVALEAAAPLLAAAERKRISDLAVDTGAWCPPKLINGMEAKPGRWFYELLEPLPEMTP